MRAHEIFSKQHSSTAPHGTLLFVRGWDSYTTLSKSGVSRMESLLIFWIFSCQILFYFALFYTLSSFCLILYHFIICLYLHQRCAKRFDFRSDIGLRRMPNTRHPKKGVSDVEYSTFDYTADRIEKIRSEEGCFGCRIFDIQRAADRMSNIRHSTSG